MKVDTRNILKKSFLAVNEKRRKIEKIEDMPP